MTTLVRIVRSQFSQPMIRGKPVSCTLSFGIQ